MRKFYKADAVKTEKAEAVLRPLSAQPRKPAGQLKQRILTEQQKLQGAELKAQLLAALRPRGGARNG
jgi:hypothetical protein